ncbi:MAG: PaaI family thioesterase [Syntrophomonas sp.]
MMASFEQIEAHLTQIPVNQYLQVRLVEIGEGLCKVVMPYNPQLTNSWQSTHGGVLVTLADMTFFLAQATQNGIDSSGRVATAEIKTNFLSSNRGSTLKAEGRVIKNGKRLIFGEVKVFNFDNTAISHSTLSYLKL